MQLKIPAKISVAIIMMLGACHATCQNLISMATDVGLQRNFKKEQLYWAFGHTTQVIFHITPTDGAYIGFAYYSPGHYKNNLTASAKAPATTPQEIDYTNKAKMRLKQFTIGWRRYLKGQPDGEKMWNLYGFAGFGLLLGNVNNTHSVAIDTADYNLPVLNGKADFKRLTLDLGAGWEYPVGADFFLYTEAKAWIPTTAYPSEFIFVNRNAPFTGMLTLGLRMLF